MKSFKLIALVAFTTLISLSSTAQNSKTIVQNAAETKDLSTLVTALQAAALVETLSSKGPYTVFAPLNKAFEKLPEGTLTTLLKPENKALLQSILTYHVVAGNLDSKAVVAAIQKGNGSVTLTTVQGGKLVASLDGSNVILTDEKGQKSKIVAVDVTCSNGVVHVIDTVLMPK